MHRISGNGNTPADQHTDPDYVAAVEVFDNLTYDEIHRGVIALNPAVLTAGRQAWRGSSAGLSDAVQQAHAEIRAAIADGWRGNAAEMAADAVRAFEQRGLQLSDVMAEVERRLGQASDAAETLRAAVSQPIIGRPDLAAALLDPKQAAANVTLQKEAESLRQDVVRVMDAVYTKVFVPTGDGVPAFPDGGMYPRQPAPASGPADAAPGPGAGNVVTPGATGSEAPVVVLPQAAVPDPGRPEAARPDDTQPPTGAGGRPAAATAPPAAAMAPAAMSAPATAPIAPAAGAAEQDMAGPSAPKPPLVTGDPGVRVNGGVPQANRPTGPMPTAVSGVSTAAQSTDSQRKRDDQDHPDADPDPAAGMGAGIVGGLAGGAYAAGDAVRSSSALPVRIQPAVDDEDDAEYYLELDEPTFLEPAEPGSELVGHLEPTTPPVLGEWADDV
jgi:uncharacterized protein YukE